MAIQEPALLHAIIFCADGYSSIKRRKKEQASAVMHLRQAIQLVNEKLLSPVPNVTDATIVVVCTLAMVCLKLSAPSGRIIWE